MRTAVIIGLALWPLGASTNAQTLRLKRAPVVVAPTLTEIPPAARARQTALLLRVTPDQRAFIARTAPTATSAETVRTQAVAAFPGSSSGDIEAMVLLVMMAAADEADADLHSAMSDMQSLRLQMVMDRRAKAMSALSNILRKTSDTSDGIIQNIK